MLSQKIFNAILLASFCSSIYAAPNVSIVFDGSGSMCGYFTPNNNSRVLLNLIQEAMIARGSAADVQVFSLRQKNKNQVNAKADLVPVSANFQAQAEVLDQQGKKNAKGCAPFDGIGSNVELIFSPQSEVSHSNAMVLVTDAQLQDADRDVFIQGYDAWAKGAIKEGKTPYAGYIVAQANFEGGYYPIAEPNEKLRAAGYVLSKHNRPLSLFWFVKGEEKLPVISNLAKAFANSKPIVQHLLPFTQSSSLPFTTVAFNSTPTLAQLIADAGKITTIQRYDTGRSENVLRSCFKSTLQEDTLLLQAKPSCADNKAFWEGVNSLKYSIQAKEFAPNTQVSINNWLYNTKTKSFELTLDRMFKEATFSINTTLASREHRSSLANWSLNSDFCPNVGKKSKECLAQLNGKTYQLDILSQQMSNRSQSISQELLAPINNQTFTIRLKYK